VSFLELHRFEDRSIYKIMRNLENPMVFKYQQLSAEEITELSRDLAHASTKTDITKTNAASDGGQTTRLAAREDYTNEEYRRRH
jgi:hypothetical protein